jgi:mono/diheme cytochrome c family protein
MRARGWMAPRRSYFIRQGSLMTERPKAGLKHVVLAGLCFCTSLILSDGGVALANPEFSAQAAKNPLDTAKNVKVGLLKSPYEKEIEARDTGLAEEGHQLFMNYGCPGCHGAGGGGGICPPITNGIWIYGDKDDTLFRLVALGTVDLQKQGFQRMAIENVVAPMPPFGGIIPNNDSLWKIIAWVKIQAFKNTNHAP